MSSSTTNVVVGGASGMGLAVAAALAERGPLLVADRDVEAAEAVAKALGTEALGVECDVTDSAHVRALRSRVERLGSLVITAGLSPHMARGDSIYAVNLVGTTCVLGEFEDAVEVGSVAICFASMAGHLMVPPQPVLDVIDNPLAQDFFGRLRAAGVDPGDPNMAYLISKLGVIRIVRRLAPEWGRRGGRILSLSPGVIDTPMGKLEAQEIPGLEDMMNGLPISRLGRPEEIASVVAFLCSDGASYMTGSDVLVDGGSVAMMPGLPQ